MARAKKDVVVKKHVAEVTHKPAPKKPAIPEHNGPPKEPDSLAPEQQESVEKIHAEQETHEPRRRRVHKLSIEERIEKLEQSFASLTQRLRPHGIHLPADDTSEQTEG